ALAGAVLGITGGFRPTTVAFLLPIWLLGMARLVGRSDSGIEPRRHEEHEEGAKDDEKIRSSLRARWRAVGVSAGLLLLFTVGWLVPTAAAAGGFGHYIRLTREMDSTLHVSAVWEVADPRAALRLAGYSHRRCFECMLGLAWLLLPFAVATTC